MADYCMFLESVIRGYHVYLKDHTLTLGEILTVESDPESVNPDKFGMKFISSEEDTVGHIPKHISEICFCFVEDGGQIDAEVIGKRFNSGDGMGVEVPVEIRFVGNKQYLKKIRRKLQLAVQAEHSKQEKIKPTKLRPKLPSDIELN